MNLDHVVTNSELPAIHSSALQNLLTLLAPFCRTLFACSLSSSRVEGDNKTQKHIRKRSQRSLGTERGDIESKLKFSAKTRMFCDAHSESSKVFLARQERKRSRISKGVKGTLQPTAMDGVPENTDDGNTSSSDHEDGASASDSELVPTQAVGVDAELDEVEPDDLEMFGENFFNEVEQQSSSCICQQNCHRNSIKKNMILT